MFGRNNLGTAHFFASTKRGYKRPSGDTKGYGGTFFFHAPVGISRGPHFPGGDLYLVGTWGQLLGANVLNPTLRAEDGSLLKAQKDRYRRRFDGLTPRGFYSLGENPRPLGYSKGRRRRTLLNAGGLSHTQLLFVGR